MQVCLFFYQTYYVVNCKSAIHSWNKIRMSQWPSQFLASCEHLNTSEIAQERTTKSVDGLKNLEYITSTGTWLYIKTFPCATT